MTLTLDRSTCAMNGGGLETAIRSIFGSCRTHVSEASALDKWPAVRTNARIRAARRASRWIRLWRILLSLVRTTHPLEPTTGSQPSSGMSSAKWSEWRSTTAPAAVNAATSVLELVHRSRKKTTFGLRRAALVPDRFFDCIRIQSHVRGDIPRRITCQESFRDDGRRHAGTCQTWSPELYARIDEDGPPTGLLPAGREGIKPDRCASCIALDSIEVADETRLHGHLALIGHIDQFPVALDEEIRSVGLHLDVGKRMAALEPAAQVIDSLADLDEPDAVITSNRTQNVELNEVSKGQRTAAGVCDMDHGREEFSTVLDCRISSAENPRANGGLGHSNQMGHLGDRVRGQLDRIAAAVNVEDSCHEVAILRVPD